MHSVFVQIYFAIGVQNLFCIRNSLITDHFSTMNTFIFHSFPFVHFRLNFTPRTVWVIRHIYLILLSLLALSPVQADTTGNTFDIVDRANFSLSAGYAILIQGSLPDQEGLEAYNQTLNRVYHRLRQSGFQSDDMVYFNYDHTQPQVNDIPSKQAIEDAIEIWAPNKMNRVPAPLYIIMVDHGSTEGFYIGNEMMSPFELNTMLAKLELSLNQAAHKIPIVVVIGASYSGAFIPKLSKQGRVIITSATDKEASERGLFEIEGGGELFIDVFFDQLWRGASLKEAFIQGAAHFKILTRTDIVSANTVNFPYLDHAKQHPLLDDNGDGKGSHHLSLDGDGQQAATLFLGKAAQKSLPDNQPEIVAVTPTVYLNEGENASVLFLEANDPHFVDTAQILIRSPSKKRNSEVLDYNAESKRFEIGYTDFNEPGRYEIFYTAKNNAQPATLPERSLVYKNRSDNAQPEPFELITPADGDEIQTHSLFDWQTTTDPDGEAITYHLILAEDEAFTVGVKTLTQLIFSMASLDNHFGLKNDTVYYWKVEAIDQFGAKTESETRHLITNNHNDNYTAINVSIRDDVGFIPATLHVTQNDQALPPEKQPDIAQDETTGIYKFDFPMPGHYHLEIDAEGFIPKIEPLHVIGHPDRPVKRSLAHLNTAQRIDVEFVLTPCPSPCQLSAYHASGKIFYDKKGDNPIAGVSVQIGDQSDMTDDLGFWKIIHLPEGEYQVTANKKGYIFSDKRCVMGNGEDCHPDFSEPDSEIQLKVVANQRPLEQGANLSYRITVTNQGDKTATDIILTEDLPVGTSLVSIEALNGGQCNENTLTCHLADLTPGQHATAEVIISNSQAKTLKNRVTVMANEYPDDQQITWTKVIPYLSLSISHAPVPIEITQDLHYSLTAQLNRYAPVSATGIELVTVLPKAVELKSLNSDNAICDLSEFSKITCLFSDLQANTENSQATVNIEVVLTEPGLLMLIYEGEIKANEYPTHTNRARSKIAIPDDIQVDMSIVLDVTASMTEEINGIVTALKAIIAGIDPEKAPLIALIIFTDEVTIKAFTRDINVLLEAIEKLKISGGGSCPEASAEALSIAIPHTKKGGDILLATDASPYDDADVEKLIQQLRKRRIRFSPVISGDCEQTEDRNE